MDARPNPLKVSNVNVSYGSTSVVKDVSFDVQPGEVVALVGQNGAGKSSTIRAIAGLQPYHGAIKVSGHEAGTNAAKQRLRLAPQTTAFTPGMTVAQNLAFVERLLGAGQHASTHAETLMGLESFRDVRADRLSGGLARRLHVASALIGGSDLLILDEPSIGMDLESRRCLLDAVRKVAGTGTGVLYVSHQFDEIEALADQIVVIAHGRVLLKGTPQELRRKLDYLLVRVSSDGAKDFVAPGIAFDVQQTDSQLSFSLATSAAPIELAGFLRGNGGQITDLEVRPPSLEDAIVALVSSHETSGGAP